MAAIEVLIISQLWGESLEEILAQLLPQTTSIINLKLNVTSPNAIDFNSALNDEQLQQCRNADIIIADNSFFPQLYGLPKLKWVQGTYAGVDKVAHKMRALVKERGKPQFFTTRFTGDYYGTLMAEYCLSYIISMERGFIDHRDLQKTKDWKSMKAVTPKSFRTIDEVTIGIIGLGSIGQVLARKFHSLGAKVIAYNRSPKDNKELEEIGVSYFSQELSDILSKSEYLICILPHTSETVGLLNGKFNNCSKGTVFINLGRGSVVASTEIIKALDEGFLSRAILDVFEDEPLPPSSPLWLHPNVVITPHISAVTTARHLALLFKKNYDKFINNEKLDFIIDWENEY
ncbi:hypothetical protein B4U80_02398 [Leptotrombidium deliense]|uniref:D-isomer specific 2-hydroxyacid dehydrogenase NAD-binding domain-containing protein n=1 Tax=Leptotrombidium deliense TaxID=299467 RepID=A0A443SPX5_9ACAR|nr:hypothetical protein B4U80_02398 [Leptotrombidium deliense]